MYRGVEVALEVEVEVFNVLLVQRGRAEPVGDALDAPLLRPVRARVSVALVVVAVSEGEDTARAATGGRPEILLDLLEVGAVFVGGERGRVDARVELADEVVEVDTRLLWLLVFGRHKRHDGEGAQDHEGGAQSHALLGLIRRLEKSEKDEEVSSEPTGKVTRSRS